VLAARGRVLEARGVFILTRGVVLETRGRVLFWEELVILSSFSLFLREIRGFRRLLGVDLAPLPSASPLSKRRGENIKAEGGCDKIRQGKEIKK
jgi:hypothetical protein